LLAGLLLEVLPLSCGFLLLPVVGLYAAEHWLKRRRFIDQRLFNLAVQSLWLVPPLMGLFECWLAW